jgi:hydroxyethylthiazole kinase-like uncharacterized protein yjeF
MHAIGAARALFSLDGMDNSLYSVAQLRAIEQAVAPTLPPGTLMQRAGEAAARMALYLLGARRERPVLVLAGPGNNGGDALELAANLAHAGIAVTVWHQAGAGAASAETASALQRARASTVNFVDTLADDRKWGLAVDGLFGIGLARPLEGAFAEAAKALGALACPVLALDVPSGLDADTGAVIGLDGVAVQATHTITFIGDKPGLHTGDGRDHAGVVRVDTLGIKPRHFVSSGARLNATALFAAYLKPRRENSHKGSFGDVAVVGGAQGMAGAALLAARAALYGGAGRVFVAAIDPGPTFDSVQPEIMFRDAGGFEFGGKTVVAGPGMGQAAAALRVLSKVLDSEGPLVLDADGLNQLAGSPELQARLAQRGGDAVLTPHPLEAARLLGVTSGVVQGDRLAAARELAARLDAIVVLKGSGTVIARPDGELVVNRTGNPGLATGGSGDVLAGLCGALLAQGWPGWEAALGAVWIHGAAADRLAGQQVGPIGMTAGELPPAARAVLNKLVAEAAARNRF